MAQYGKHGLRAFLAAHHSNCIFSADDPRPWCDRDWQAYDDAIDRGDRNGELIAKQDKLVAAVKERDARADIKYVLVPKGGRVSVPKISSSL